MARDDVVTRIAESVNALVGARRDLKDVVLSGPCTLSEVGILRRLELHGPQRVTRLADVLGVDASVVSRQAAQLVQNGLAERAPDPDDGRSHLLAVTTSGRAVLSDARARLYEAWDVALSEWSADDLEALASGMSRLIADLAGTVGRAAPAAPAAAPAAHPDDDGRERSAALPSAATGTTIRVGKEHVLV